MKIAIFADIHGKFLLPFKLVDLYQKETSCQIDLILQCGDMGAFPDIENLDKATLRHASRDRDELGFYDDFVKEKPEIRQFLNELNLNMICVRGNHEDHNFLNELEEKETDNSIFPIDAYQRVWVCKSAQKQEFSKNGEKLTFVGIGRIGDRKDRKHQEFIQDYERKEINKLIQTKDSFDLLITHDYGDLSQRGFGMPEIRKVLDNVIFSYHFYGHTGEPFRIGLDENELTISVKIKELEFDNEGMLPEGCMLIVEKHNQGNFDLIAVEQSFTCKVTKFNWRFY
jgi:predicted phosphodiesterase